MKRYIIVYLPTGEQVDDTRKYKNRKGAVRFLKTHVFRYQFNDITKPPYVSSTETNDWTCFYWKIVPKYLFDVIEIEEV